MYKVFFRGTYRGEPDTSKNEACLHCYRKEASVKLGHIVCWGALAIAVAVVAGCSEKTSRTAAEGSVNSSATLASSNDTLRVNQPRAYQQSEAVRAAGTNVQLVEASGANLLSSNSALAERLKTTLESDPASTTAMQGVRITESNGKITLTGTVRTQVEKDFITNKAREIAGESKVENRLQVSSSFEIAPVPDLPKNKKP